MYHKAHGEKILIFVFPVLMAKISYLFKWSLIALSQSKFMFLWQIKQWFRDWNKNFEILTYRNMQYRYAKNI